MKLDFTLTNVSAKFDKTIINLPLLLLFSTLLMQWLILIEIDSLYIKPIQVSILFLFVNTFFLLNKNTLKLFKKIWKQSYFFMFFQLTYFLITALSLEWSDTVYEGILFIVKQLIYFLLAILIIINICHKKYLTKGVRNGLYLGSVIGILSIGIYFLLSPESVNIIWLGLVSGNEETINIGFIRLFKSLAEKNKESVEIQYSLRHDIVGLIMVMGLIIGALRNSNKNTRKYEILLEVKKKYSFKYYLEKVLIVFSCLITIISLSRQSLVQLLLIIFVILLFKIKKSNFQLKSNKIILIILLLFSLSVIAFVYSDLIYAPINLLLNRVSSNTSSYSERLKQIDFAIDLISQDVLMGQGAGVLFKNSEEFQIHNFFFLSWCQSGILSFIISILMYVSLITYWIKSLFLIINNPSIWVIPVYPEYIFAFPVFPLVRAFLSGNSFQGLLDWIPIGIFIGFLYLNYQSYAVQQGTD